MPKSCPNRQARHSNAVVPAASKLPRRTALAWAIASALNGMALTSQAADFACTWTNAANGTWNVAANWDACNATFPNNGSPNPTYDANIASVGSGYTVTLNSNVTLNVLTVNSANATLAQTSGSLTLLLDSSIAAGTYAFSSGTLDGVGNLTIAAGAALNWSGGTMTGSGTTILQGASTLNGGGTKGLDAGRVLENRGTLTWSQGGLDLNATQTGGSGRILNTATGVFDMAGDLLITRTSSFADANTPPLARFDNAGTFRKSAGVTTGTIDSGVAFNNTGTVEANSGTLVFNGGGSVGGTYDIVTGAILQFGGGTHAFQGATFNNAGLVRFAGAVMDTAQNQILGPGTYQLSSFSQIYGVADLQIGTGATFNWTGGAIGGDASTATATNAPGTLTVNGVLNLSGGNLTLNRDTTVNGTMTWAQGGFQFQDATVSLTNNGLFLDTVNSDHTLSWSSGGLAPTFTNAATGTFRKDENNTTTFALQLDNVGTVDIDVGTLTFNGNVVQHAGNTLTGGTWIVGAGGSLNLNESGAQNIVINRGDVTLEGPTANFARIDSLTNNEGAFRLLNNRNFTAVSPFTNAGMLQLGGGTFNTGGASQVVNSPTGTIFGFGTIAPVISNEGTVRAQGGVLTVTGGIDGQSGTIETAPGGTLVLGADSDGDFLINNGTLDLNGAGITVAVDYTNANFGTGNGFNHRANVVDTVGAGAILAAGDVVQHLTGEVAGGTTVSATMNFGNIHVGDAVTRNYSVANAGTTGPNLRGALQTGANGGNITDPRLSGTGVTAANFGPIALGASSAYAVTFTGSSAGLLAGQAVHVTNNFDNVGDQDLQITGAAYRYANPTTHTPEPVLLGNFHVGGLAETILSVTNDVPNDGFSESLNASISPTTGNATASGSFNLLAAGATDNSSLRVGVNTAQAGTRSGTATIAFVSDGQGTSGLGQTALTTAAQTVNVSANVFRFAAPGAHAPEPVTLGDFHVDDLAEAALSITNTAAADGFSEALNATITAASGQATATGSFNLLGAGSTDNASLRVGVTTTNAGVRSGTATIAFVSDGQGTSGLGQTALTGAAQTVNVNANVYRYAQASAASPDPIDFGNRHLNSLTQQALTISNLATNDGFSERLNASFTSSTGSATRQGAVVQLAAGATDDAALVIGMDTSSVGNKTGTATLALVSDGNGINSLGLTDRGTQTIDITGAVFRLAAGAAHLPEPVVLGNLRQGLIGEQALTITNLAANDGFSERLNVRVNGTTGAATSNNGLISLLGPAASDTTTIRVGIDQTQAGSRSGTVLIELISDGAGTSGLGQTGLEIQTVNVSGEVFRLAQASLTPTVIDLGSFHVGDLAEQALSLTNTAANDGYSESLNAAFDAAATTGDATTQGAVNLLAAQGSSDNLRVGVSTGTAGAKGGTAGVDFASDGTGTSGFGALALDPASATVTVSARVFGLAQPQFNATDVMLAARRVGDAGSTALVTYRNDAPADGFHEGLDANFGAAPGGFQLSGDLAVTDLGAGGERQVLVTLDTASGGAQAGNVAVTLASNGTISGLANSSLPGVTVNLSGNVYAPAVADVQTTLIDFGIVHVGDTVATRSITVQNDAVGALTDALHGAIGPDPTGFTGTGTLAGLGAGSTDSSSLQIGLDTGSAGNLAGQASLQFFSRNPEMSDLALADRTVSLLAQVNNFANPDLDFVSGNALLGGTEPDFTLDFGTFVQGSGARNATLALSNDVLGPADLLRGEFSGDDGLFDLTGFTAFRDVAAGGAHTLSIGLDGLALGDFQDQIVINLFGYNASGFEQLVTTFRIDIRASVAPVPLPPAVWLLGGALTLIAARRRADAGRSRCL